MRAIVDILMLCSLFLPYPVLASHEPPASDCALTFDLLLERAVSRKLIAGGVIVTGNRDGILSTAAQGRINGDPGSPLLNDRTAFDLASLTKVVATAPAVMKLLDQGLIELSDPLSRWFPEFAQAGPREITILNLLTHTSGLTDFDIGIKHSMGRAVRKAAARRHRQWTGYGFDYADINFILLGELVRRVSGQRLDAFCERQIYAPLAARETMFLPPRDPGADIAPTAGYRGGVVSDVNARRLGSVAGHAGLFSSAYDLSRFARLILGRGMIDDNRILSEQAVDRMTSPYLCNNGRVRRGLGWDIDSPFSKWKGDFFSEASFGHTGYSGSSIWIDPRNDRFVILLTRRVNYRDADAFNQLRTDVSTIASADLGNSGGNRALDPLWELAKIRERLLQPERVILQRAPGGDGASAQSGRKWLQRPKVQRRSARAQGLLTKAGRKVSVSPEVAGSDKTYKNGSGSRKGRNAQKGSSG